MHLKRQAMSKTWPLPRKGTTFVAVPSHSKTKAISLLVALRDLLGFADTRKEAKTLLRINDVFVNWKRVKDEKFPLQLYDVLSFPSINKHYRVTLSATGKFTLEEINEKEARVKISKIIGKKTLKGGVTQINLFDGMNFIVDKPLRIGDSVVVDFRSRKIKSVIELKPQARALVIGGKHIGKRGKIQDVHEEGGKQIATLATQGEKINVWTKNIMAIE